MIKITPEVWDNSTDANTEALKTIYDPKLDPFYSVDINVPPYTTYTMDQILACKGPVLRRGPGALSSSRGRRSRRHSEPP